MYTCPLFKVKKMKTLPRLQNTISVEAEIVEGESIEQKMEKIIQGNERVEITRSLIYQERRNGILPEYNIRTDKHEILREAVNGATQKYFEARDIRGKERHKEEESHVGEPNTAS